MGLKGKVIAQKKAQKKKTETSEVVKEVQCSVDSMVEQNADSHLSESGKLYPEKIDIIYGQSKNGDVFFEVLEDGFNLTKEKKGYETKVHFNFIQLDKNMKQKVFITHFLDITNFLYLRYLFISGKAFSLEKMQREDEKNIQSIFIEFKTPKDGTKRVFTVTPGKKKGNWMIGVSFSKEGKTERVSVPVTTERLIGSLELIYLAYQKHLFKH